MDNDPLRLTGFIEGTLVLDTDFNLRGLIDGSVTCRDIWISESGSLKGNLKCRNAVVLGTITGEVTVSGRLSARKNATIDGKLCCNEVEIEKGAVLNCQIQNLSNETQSFSRLHAGSNPGCDSSGGQDDVETVQSLA
jgi:cytoskeletal protein CcmA (bactofilin family)